MCAAGHKPDTFEFVARMGRLSFGTDGDEEEDSKDKVPLSFIIPALPNRTKERDISSLGTDVVIRRVKKGKSDQGVKLGRNQRAAKSVDIDTDEYDERVRQGEFSSQSTDFENRRGKNGKSDQEEFSSQSTDFENRRGKNGKSDQELSRRSSDDILFRVRESRKKHEQDLARKHAKQHAVNETVRGPHYRRIPPDTNHVS